MHRTLVALATTVACLIVAPAAFAWDGAHWSKNTCGADLTAKAASGSWWIRVSDDSGTLAEASNIPAKAYTDTVPLTVGGFSHDGGYHLVKYEAANAANHADGYVSYTQPQWNCTGGRGPAGPAGPKGDPGVGYDCTGTAVPTGGSPALCPGTPGKATPPPPILVPKTTCTSKRVYRFLVRKSYEGHLIRNVRAKDPDAKMTVKRITSGKLKGRLQVTADYRGKKFTGFTHARHIEVDALVATRGWLILNENADLCRPANGHQNAPSASSDAKPDAGSADAARVSSGIATAAVL